MEEKTLTIFQSYTPIHQKLTLSLNITIQLTAHEPWLCCVDGIALDTHAQLLGLTGFVCLERPNGSTPNGIQHMLGWQTCTVTADLCLDHQNFRARAFLPMGVDLGLGKLGVALLS